MVYAWCGKNASRGEKSQTLSKARQLRDERGGECNVVCVDDGEEKEMGKDELKLFEAKFPLKDKVSKLKNEPVVSAFSPPPIGTDDLRDSSAYLKLYRYVPPRSRPQRNLQPLNRSRCLDARDEEDGTVKIKIIEQKSGPLQKEDISSEVTQLANQKKEI